MMKTSPAWKWETSSSLLKILERARVWGLGSGVLASLLDAQKRKLCPMLAKFP